MTARLVALDLDGTLMGDDLSFSPAVLEAVRACAARGAILVLATGRAHPSARHFQRELGIAGPIICHQGAEVRGPRGGYWHAATVARSEWLAASDFADARGDDLTVYAGDVVYLKRERRESSFYKQWFGLPRRTVAAWTEVPGDATKLLAIARDPAHGDETEAAWRRRLGRRLAIVRSHTVFVEAVAPEVSKGNALALVAARLGVPRTQTLAVGDHGNDMAMLEWAGCGVAMGGAPEAVLARADVVAPPLAEDGAAWALRRFVLDAS